MPLSPGLQAYLLAAGQGRRAGGPKAWRDCGGRPLLERQLEFLRGIIPEERIGVSIQASWAERCRGLSGAVRWVAVDPEAPALAAVLALARAMPLERWTFLHHVDMRVWEPELFGGLAARALAGAADAVVPVREGRRGHPLLLSPALKEGLLGLDPEKDRLDVWLRSRSVSEQAVPYPCVLDNWNS